MRMSYKKLWLMLVEREISQATLRKDLNIATGTMTKLRRNEEVCRFQDKNAWQVVSDRNKNGNRPQIQKVYFQLRSVLRRVGGTDRGAYHRI